MAVMQHVHVLPDKCTNRYCLRPRQHEPIVTTKHDSSASEDTTLWRYTNLFIIKSVYFYLLETFPI